MVLGIKPMGAKSDVGQSRITKPDGFQFRLGRSSAACGSTIVPPRPLWLGLTPICHRHVASLSCISNDQPRLAVRATALAKSQPTTRKGVMAILLRIGEATAHDIASRLSISVQVTRRHLRSLELEGLVEGAPSAAGPGRPSFLWRLSGQGQAQFADGSEAFALNLLQSLSSNLPQETLEALLNCQASQQANRYRERLGEGPLEQRVARLVELRKAEGFVAEGDRDGDSYLISEFHCSVMRIAEQFPCVCEQELQMMRRTFPDCAVERVQWRLEAGHCCGFRLTPGTTESA